MMPTAAVSDACFHQAVLLDRVAKECEGRPGFVLVVELRLGGGTVLDVCHVIALSERWMSVAFVRDIETCEDMDVTFVPYERVIRSRCRSTTGATGPLACWAPALLVTVDGSSESEAVLPTVIDLSKRTGASVTLLTVGGPRSGVYPRSEEPIAPLSIGTQLGLRTQAVTWKLRSAPEPIESHGQALASVESDAIDYLAAIARRLSDAGVKPVLKVLISEEVGAAIAALARDERFDIIAMSTHGRSGWASWFTAASPAVWSAQEWRPSCWCVRSKARTR